MTYFSKKWSNLPFIIENAMNEWLCDHFRQPGRPKCLILIGPTGTGYYHMNHKNWNKNEKFEILGKTSFALSLPGVPNHCRGCWSSNHWNNNADYIIIDDVPWNEFHQRGFPNPEEILTGQEFLNVCNQIHRNELCRLSSFD